MRGITNSYYEALAVGITAPSEYTEYTGTDAVQEPVGRFGNPMDIANMVLFL